MLHNIDPPISTLIDTAGSAGQRTNQLLEVGGCWFISRLDYLHLPNVVHDFLHLSRPRFVMSDPHFGLALWTSDGTESGTQ